MNRKGRKNTSHARTAPLRAGVELLRDRVRRQPPQRGSRRRGTRAGRSR